MNVEVNERNTLVALRNMATVRVLKRRLDSREKQAKAYLDAAMAPGERRVALLDDGTEVGTVTRTRDGEPQLVVQDMVGFVEWLRTHEPHLAAKVTMVPVLPDWVVASGNLESLVADNDGELPPGVGFSKPRSGYPRCSVSTAQEDAFVGAVAELRSAVGLLEAGELE